MEGRTGKGADPQEGRPEKIGVKQLLSGSFRYDPACLEHIPPIRQVQGLSDILLHQQDQHLSTPCGGLVLVPDEIGRYCPWKSPPSGSKRSSGKRTPSGSSMKLRDFCRRFVQGGGGKGGKPGGHPGGLGDDGV